MTYHVARNNQQLGTVSKEEFLQRYQSGTYLPTDLVWAEGMASWEPASKIFGAPIAPAGGGADATATPPPYAPPPYVPASAPVTGVATPIPTMPGAAPVVNSEPCPPDHKTLAIVATVLSVLTCSIISLVLAIIAIVMATQVTTKYNLGDLQGAKSSSKTSKILSWIAIGILILALFFGIVFGVIGALSSASRY